MYSVAIETRSYRRITRISCMAGSYRLMNQFCNLAARWSEAGKLTVDCRHFLSRSVVSQRPALSAHQESREDGACQWDKHDGSSACAAGGTAIMPWPYGGTKP